MIEAVNSVLQNQQFVRGNNEQISTADSYAANPDRVQKVPQAPYVSPFIHLDVQHNTAVIQFRDNETGDVKDQFPSESRLQDQARQAARQQVQNEQKQAATPDTQAESAQAFVQDTQNSDSGAESSRRTAAATAQEQAAFAAAAQSGNSNAGNVTLFA